jgi:type I restriction enzyme S subunit
VSSKTFLEKLLNGVVVEWLPLGDLTRYEQPTRYLVTAQNYSDEFTTPVLTAGKTFILGYTDERHGIYEGSQSPVIIFDDFTTANKWVDFDFKVKSSAVKLITSSDEDRTLLKYIFYWLNTVPSEFVNGDHKRQWIGTYSSKNVPIPCPDNPRKSLQIQAEIVRILDAFTELSSELSAALSSELSARKKQYNYYRGELLNFEDREVAWKTLGEVAEIGTGSHDTQDAVENGDFVFYARGREPLRLNVFDFDETAIITAGDGAGVGKVFHYAEGKYALHQRAYRIVPGKGMESRFLYHYIASCFYRYIQRASVSSSVTSLRRPMFLNFPVPVPSLSEQKGIVARLDNFGELANSINESLPREIELRRKQYEYYRDLLLSFPKLESVEA